MPRKPLLFLVGLFAVTAMVVLVAGWPTTISAQGPAPQATVAAGATAQPTGAAIQPTTVVTATTPPVAVLKLLHVVASPADPNAITTTFKSITSTETGAVTSVVAMGAANLSNVPINVPVHFAVEAKDPKITGTPTWRLTAPPGSKAAIKNPTAMSTEFTPDLVGDYKVDVTLRNSAGASNQEALYFTAGTYIGYTAGNCQQCHPLISASWNKTAHSRVFTDLIDNTITPNTPTLFWAACTSCHTTGWYAQPYNGSGGFLDAQAKIDWQYPSFKQIDDAGKKNGPSNWSGAPDVIKNMANVQCEDCHGPASEHVKNGAKVMATSYDAGVCDSCHAGAGHNSNGVEFDYSKMSNQLRSSKHVDEQSAAWTTPTGPEEQNCVRCHTAMGYASFLKNPTNAAAWKTEAQTLSCTGCHDPHALNNPFQLRITGVPVNVPYDNPRNVGLSATCYECHNNRTRPENAPNNSYAHYSSASEMLSNTGGVTYGKTVPNSGHAAIGSFPIPNPNFTRIASTNQFMFSEVGDTRGNAPGPCVTCHMWTGPSSPKDPGYLQVGEHSFNTISPDGKVQNTAICTTCHGQTPSVDKKSPADYDGNGKIEGVQEEVKGLLDYLWKTLEASGFKKTTGNPYATIPQNAEAKLKNAWYNFRYVYGVMWSADTPGGQGKAAAIHNFKRSVALLQLSITDLTGKLPAGAAEMK